MTDAKDDRLYLVHIVECIERVRRYTVGGRDAFMSDEMTRDAVVRNLQVLAESTQRLSPGTRAQHPTVNWRQVGHFRNVVVHRYISLDYERVWLVVEQDLDPLEQVVLQILADMDASSASGT